MKGLFLFSIFVIIYGSLFPFNFQSFVWPEEGVRILLSTSFFGSRMGDLIGNIVLFIPFGFAGTILISRNNLSRLYILYLYLFGVILAVALQFLQTYLPSRVPALYDALWNYAGIFLGSMLARFMGRRFPNMIHAEDKLALLALLLSWIAFLLTPFIFSFDMEILKDNISTHLDVNEHRITNILFYLGIWIAFKKLIDELLPNNKNILVSLELIVVITLIAKVFVYRDLIEPELLSGAILAIILIRSGLFKVISPYKVSAALLVPIMLYNSLYPFEFFDNPYKEFVWLPFGELFSDDILSTIRTVLYKTFAYGCIVWTLYKSFPNANWVSYFCVLYACLIEYLQHLTAFRVGGFTEPLMVLFLCTFIYQHKETEFDLYEKSHS